MNNAAEQHGAPAIGVGPGTPEILKIGFRVPALIPGEPELWFSQLEQSFIAAAITTEATKFSYLCSNLDPRHAIIVKDLIMTPPVSTPYTTTKVELLKRLNISQDSKTRQLLEEQVLGDRTPSQFLRHLRGLAVDGIPEAMVRTLWISRLPVQVQVILMTQHDRKLDMVAELADKIVSTFQSAQTLVQPQIAAADALPSVAVDRLSLQIAQLALSLCEEIAEVRRAATNNRGWQRSRSASRRRSPSRGQSDDAEHCWYHRRFWTNATRCRKPSTFSGNATDRR